MLFQLSISVFFTARVFLRPAFGQCWKSFLSFFSFHTCSCAKKNSFKDIISLFIRFSSSWYCPDDVFLKTSVFWDEIKCLFWVVKIIFCFLHSWKVFFLPYIRIQKVWQKVFMRFGDYSFWNSVCNLNFLQAKQIFSLF